MSRRPLAPDVWEQALINGRRMHSSDSAAAISWAEQWYADQGCVFEGSIDAPAPLPEPAESAVSSEESEALTLKSDPAPIQAEPETAIEHEVVPEPVKTNKPRRRAHQKSGQLKGDDPTTPDVNEAWDADGAA